MTLRAETGHIVLVVHGFRGSVLHKHWNSFSRSLTIGSIAYPDATFGIPSEDCPDDLGALFIRFPLGEAGPAHPTVEIHRPFADWAWRFVDGVASLVHESENA